MRGRRYRYVYATEVLPLLTASALTLYFWIPQSCTAKNGTLISCTSTMPLANANWQRSPSPRATSASEYCSACGQFHAQAMCLTANMRQKVAAIVQQGSDSLQHHQRSCLRGMRTQQNRCKTGGACRVGGAEHGGLGTSVTVTDLARLRG